MPPSIETTASANALTAVGRYLHALPVMPGLTESGCSCSNSGEALDLHDRGSEEAHRLARSMTTIFSLLLATTFAGASDARADLAKWDSAKVTAAAEELAQATVALRDGLRSKPPPTLGQGGRRAFWALNDEVRGLTSTSRRLQRALAEGAGMEETYPTFRRLVRSGRRAVREVRRLDLGETTLANIEAVADGVRKLRPYYEPEPPI